MKRRSLLAASSTSILLGMGGCLGNLEGTNDGSSDDDDTDDEQSYEEIDLDCERFKGSFGVLVVGVPVAVPEEATVIDIEETGIHEYEVVAAEMEHARETRSEAEERISEYDEVGEMIQTGGVELGNGDRYADVKASLNEYESIEAKRLGPRWYVTYRGDVYGLSLGESPLPFRLGNPGDESNSESAMIDIFAINSVPDDAVVIDAVEENLDDHEHLGEVLTIAGCSDDIEGVRSGRNQIADYHIPPDQYPEIRELLGDSRKTDAGWYVGYDAEVYRLALSLAVP